MAAVAETYSVNTEQNINNVANVMPMSQPILMDDDGDSRDSGVSVGSCVNDVAEVLDVVVEKSVLKIGDVQNATHRQALVDCSNMATKTLVNSSSKNAPYFHIDTPPSRKAKAVVSSGRLDQSEYEKKQQMSNRQYARILNMDGCSQPSRKRISSGSCSSVQKRSRQIQLQGNETEDAEEVFFNFEPPLHAPLNKPSSVSLWDVSTAHNHRSAYPLPRKTSDDSLNSSSISGSMNCNGPMKPMRAMSVGFIEQDSILPETLEVKYTLPAVDRPQKESQAYRSISPLTLLEEFERLGDQFYSVYVVVDCRYPFEYEGGHIQGAINIWHLQEVGKYFFAEDPHGVINKRIPIFYCEFSQKRGPAMANQLRSVDRVRNELKYPHVEYPEIYLLDNGYRSLWAVEKCQVICEPRGYCPMDQPEFLAQLKTFRGARHRSVCSTTKSTGELSMISIHSVGDLRSVPKRNLRKHKSFVPSKIRSALSSSFLDTSGDDQFADEDMFLPELGKKSISNFDLTTTSSEVDIDVHLSASAAASSSSSAHVERQKVQLAMKFKSPEFDGFSVTEALTESFLFDEAAPAESGTPRVCLDFSAISDTD